MAARKKWKIKGLDKKQELAEAAKIILKNRINNFLSSIKNYFKESSVENLHAVRIALRRVRYSMELFIDCFNKKKFLAFYREVENLQDLSGNVRDLDVMLQNIQTIINEDRVKVSNKVIKNILKRRAGLLDELKFQLIKFIHGTPLKKFMELL